MVYSSLFNITNQGYCNNVYLFSFHLFFNFNNVCKYVSTRGCFVNLCSKTLYAADDAQYKVNADGNPNPTNTMKTVKPLANLLTYNDTPFNSLLLLPKLILYKLNTPVKTGNINNGSATLKS